ncbi:MAG: protein translocase subunit SecD [Planctomycetota bacterium]|nr:protein translocase subunit SecD [Planctomycetota bacterium]
MVENLGRKVFWIAAALTAAVLCIVLPESPFRLGLDLQGGTRYLLSIDFDRALAEKKITQAEYDNRQQLMQDTVAVIRERVDPTGTKETVIRPEGADSFVVEVPAQMMRTTIEAKAPLLDRLAPVDGALSLDASDAQAAAFPLTGGVVAVGSERIKYESRDGSQLLGLERGFAGSGVGDHAPGNTVTLKSHDSIISLIQNPGSLEIFARAQTEDFQSSGTDETSELQKAQEWVDEHPGIAITGFNALDPPLGPPANIRWFPHHVMATDAAPAARDNLVPVVVQSRPEWAFSSADVDFVRPSSDEFGLPAVGVDMNARATIRFGDFTRAYVRKLMAIVINDEIISLATIEQPLFQSFRISGGSKGFTQAEVEEMVKVLKTGSLRVKPELEQEERVGATLGDHFVKLGAISALLGLALVLVFMAVYYRKLGIFAALSLLCAMTLLMGSMAFLQATLTLPGVAGIILTVGMAVDANILIYERIREESRKGRKLIQAAKNGFERASVTIIDANVTTFITAVILYYQGTGPIRGFATTLMIGIVTSVFSALVVTRILVHLALEKGAERFSMGQLVKQTRIDFMSAARKLLPLSVLLIIGGMGLFVSIPERDRMSIDFLGGFTVTVRTEEPEQTDDIRALIAAIPNVVGESAEVKPILDSGDDSAGFRQFRIVYKSEGDVLQSGQTGGEKTGQAEIADALAGVLQKGPIELELDDVTKDAGGRLYFENEHPTADISAALSAEGTLTGVSVTAVEDHPGAYEFTGAAKPDSTLLTLEQEIGQRVNGQLDGAGDEYRLALPMPGTTLVGAQVVGELRDKAIIAVLVSLFAVVMYIRVRFAEYSYGIAAVLAIVHDVLFVLGVLSVTNVTGLLDSEISLPMIAAFLTIIGYSLNDTIVVFDRIRENLPRTKGSLAEILNLSINQTLSRTLLTSITTLVAVSVLFGFNVGSGSVLEGFSFAMLVGVLVGTFSSMFVASPALLWLESRSRARQAAESAHEKSPRTETAGA